MSASASTPRSRSPQTALSSRSSSSSDHTAVAHIDRPTSIHSNCPCEKCDNINNERGVTRIDVPLIAIPRLFNALLGFATVIRVHTTIDAGWWPWEHKVLFSLCWVTLFWNLAHAICSILGYAYWPSPRRTVGLPPISVTINGKTLVSFGGPDEEDGPRRRRTKRIQFSIIDMFLAIPTLGFLIYSAHIMYPWWGSRYVGLWPPTIGLIASLV